MEPSSTYLKAIHLFIIWLSIVNQILTSMPFLLSYSVILHDKIVLTWEEVHFPDGGHGEDHALYIRGLLHRVIVCYRFAAYWRLYIQMVSGDGNL